MYNPSTAFDGLLADRILKRATDETASAVVRSDTLDGYVKRATEIMTAAIRDSDRYTEILARAMTLPYAPDWRAVSAAVPAPPLSIVTTAAALAAQYTHASMVDTYASMINVGPYPVIVGTVPASTAIWQPVTLDWVSEAKPRLQDLVSEIDAPARVKDALYAFAEHVLEACAAFQEPQIDLDHEGNIELYFKEQAEGLLLVISNEGALHAFGSSNGESWRSSYLLTGHIWKQRLRTYLTPFEQHA
jgi:hypothetical protein